MNTLKMSLVTDMIRPPGEIYGDDVLFGPRVEALRQIKLSLDDINCLVLPIGSSRLHSQSSLEQWNLNKITRGDRRVKLMIEKLGIKHALPIQRKCWPHLEEGEYPIVCIAPESSGKTMTHLLYIVSKCVSNISPSLEQPSQWIWTADADHKGASNLDTVITHPKYIIISSSQQQVDLIYQEIEQMKELAFDIRNDRGSSSRVKNLDPIVRTVSIHHEDEKLALKCNEAEILIATPGALYKCIESDYISFTKCKKVFFDDLDLTLQLHNYHVRSIMRHYWIETNLMKEKQDDSGKLCMIHMFLQKWTDLAEQFLTNIIGDRIMIFGSIAEASLFVRLHYDVETFSDKSSRRQKLLDIVKIYSTSEPKSELAAIVCSLEEEAIKISKTLTEMNYYVRFVSEEDPMRGLRYKQKIQSFGPCPKPIYVMSDGAIDQLMGSLDDITWIIHFSMPDHLYRFDQRFRLMQRNIKEMNKKKHLRTTLFLSPQFNPKQLKKLYDIVSRSTKTQLSTKLQLRDLIKGTSTTICWRWASTGTCKLNKFSSEDRFGNYCLDGHSSSDLSQNGADKHMTRNWPTSGQLKITVTHLISPSEFYFWFEAHRDKKSRTWNSYNTTGCNYMKDLQHKLNACKNTESYSIQPSEFKIGEIYGVYLRQERRVDRVRLLDMPDIDEDLIKLSRMGVYFAEQCEVLKIDYGIKMTLFLKNLFKLPEELISVNPQCYRAFHLGVKPRDNEADWQHKAKKFFYDQVCVSSLDSITVWLRYNYKDTYFWFESMKVNRSLDNIDDKRIVTSEPHLELIRAGFADEALTSPSSLPPSVKDTTLSYWHVNKSAELARFAFLRRDKIPLKIFLLHIHCDFELIVRQAEFNKQLIELEARMFEDYECGKVTPLNYFDVNVFCVARIPDGVDENTKKTIYTINRCQIITISDETADDRECQIMVHCLDHGDKFTVKKSDLFHATPNYLTQLPFQAVSCRLANLDPECLANPDLNFKIREQIYDFSRSSNNNLLPLNCEFNANSELILEVPVDRKYLPLDSLMKEKNLPLLKIDNHSDIDIDHDQSSS